MLLSINCVFWILQTRIKLLDLEQQLSQLRTSETQLTMEALASFKNDIQSAARSKFTIADFYFSSNIRQSHSSM